ncbi:hypothetical protein J0H58_25385 [bacterium]|nr:hypothetical protein [bacterium]
MIGDPVIRELSGVAASYRRAVAAAIRAATPASLRVRRVRPTETVVVYCAADQPAARVVYWVPVCVPGADPVAA